MKISVTAVMLSDGNGTVNKTGALFYLFVNED